MPDGDVCLQGCGDGPDSWTLVGALIICMSGFYIMNRDRRPGRNPAAVI
ncbi:MAG: hypothetical protein ABJN75_12590 [Hoeflea sp.]